jgi:carbon monoxide dehydrogenase subunit G
MSMELDHSFTVPVPPDRAWEVLLDVEGIAPCMPGATVEEFDGEVVTGRIKVKVGPVSLTYRGTAKFTERDPEARVVVVDASGKETRGAGTASAAIRASLEPSGEGTQVLIHTTMNVTGRPAQFGRGVIAEVGGKLLEKFAANLSQMITDGGAVGAGPDSAEGTDSAVSAADGSELSPTAASSTAEDGAPVSSAAASSTESSSAVATEAGPETTVPVTAARPLAATAPAAPAPQNEDSINLVRLVGPAILKRVLPVAAAVAAVALIVRRLQHLRRTKKA